MTADQKDGSRKGMRAIPLTQRQRKHLSSIETQEHPIEDASPATSSHKHRAPRVRRPRPATNPAVEAASAKKARATKAAKATPATTTMIATGANSKTRAASEAPRPRITRAAPTPASAPQRAPRRAAPPAAPDEPPAARELAAMTPAPRRTQRRPPVSSTPVSPLDLVDTAPLVAPASLRPSSPAPVGKPDEAAGLPETTVLPKLADTAILKAPKSGPRGGAAPVMAAPASAPLDTVDTTPLFAMLDAVETAPLVAPATPIDAIDTTHLVSPAATPIDAIDTTQLTPHVDTVDTAPLASPAAPPLGVADLAETVRLKLPRAAQKPSLPLPPTDLIDTAPLGLRAGSPLASGPTSIDAVDTTHLTTSPDEVDTTHLVTPLDALDTTHLAPPVDGVDTTHLAPPAPAVDEMDTTQLASPALAEPLDQIDTTQLGAPGSFASGSWPSAPSDPGSPRRIKVRVRRKRADSPSFGVGLLPDLGAIEASAAASSLTLNIVAGAEESRLAPTAAFAESTEVMDLPQTSKLVHAAPPEAIEAPESLDAAPAVIPAPGSTADEASGETASATLAEGAVATPTAEGVGEADLGEETFPPQPAVTTRKLPTLAVMAALANRAEARAEAEAREGATLNTTDEDVDTDRLQRPLFAAPVTPESFLAPISQPEAPVDGAVDLPAAHDAALVSDLRALLDSASDPTPLGHGRRPIGRGPRVPSQSLGATGASAAEGDSAGEGWRRLWWQRAPHRGARPTPPSAPSASSIPSAPSQALVERVERGRATAPSPHRWPAPGARQLARGRTADRGERWPEAGPGALLVWTGGVQAALSGLGALIAAIALLNGGSRALGVFGWAIAFALIAGIGAGLGHLAWRARQPRRATLAITLSHLALLVWALALFGPQPALVALVPVTVALTLRGLGRAAGVTTALVEAAFYLAALGLSAVGRWPFPQVSFVGWAAAALNGALVLAGIGLGALALVSLTAASEQERSRTLAVERAAYLSSSELDALRAETEDDADALRRALSLALRGLPTQPVRARGALSPLAEQVNITGERLTELTHDREERKRLESAARRLISNMRRAWMGLSWEWPEASGVILDDLVALLRTPPSTDAARLPEESTPTGQIVAPHLYRAGQPGVSIPSQPLNAQPGLWPDRSAPSQPSGVWPALWPSDPEPLAPGADPFALPPAPRWGDHADHADHAATGPLTGPQRNGLNGSNGHHDLNGRAP